ncbi:MAG: response regulator transcription factor [Pirellulales bacterium]|jgi:hypothetical protein|nr:response regulator transcription factor [Pirellulales bacterium]MBL7194450.1 response regulator transcription factor [Pirellulales bacterium]
MERNDSVVDEVVHLLHEGWSVRQIAGQLGIAEWRMKLLADELEQRCFGMVGLLDAPAAAEDEDSWDAPCLEPEIWPDG